MISGALEPRGSGLVASVTDDTVESVDARRTVTDKLLLSRIGFSAGILIIDDDVALSLLSLWADELLEKRRIPIADEFLFSQFMSFSDNLVKLEPIAYGLVPSDRPDGMLDALRLSRALSSNCGLLSGTIFVDLAGTGMSLAIILQIFKMMIKALLDCRVVSQPNDTIQTIRYFLSHKTMSNFDNCQRNCQYLAILVIGWQVDCSKTTE
jgi:hypothetical protein